MTKKLGLSLEKDGAYSKLVVLCTSLLSGTLIGPSVFLGVLTVQVYIIAVASVEG